jgi:hypothetical protein
VLVSFEAKRRHATTKQGANLVSKRRVYRKRISNKDRETIIPAGSLKE